MPTPEQILGIAPSSQPAAPRSAEDILGITPSKTTAKPKPQPLSLGQTAQAALSAIDATYPVFAATRRAVGTGVGKALDILARPGMATQALIARGPGAAGQAFLHSESPEQQDQDRSVVRSDLAPLAFSQNPGAQLFGSAALNYEHLPHWAQGLTDFAIDTIFDPTTYAGGSGGLEKLATAAGARATPAFARALNTLAASDRPLLLKVASGLATAHDFVNYKGAVKRALESAGGAEGKHQFRGLGSINNARRGTAADLTNELLGQYRDVIHGLKPEEEAQLYQAIHSGTVEQLPANLSMRAAKFKQITDSLAHLSGDPALRQELAQHGFTLPKPMGRFEPTTPRGIQTPEQFRSNYVPTAHDVSKFTKQASQQGIPALDQTAFRAPNEESLEDLLNEFRQEQAARKTPGLSANDPSLLPRDGGKLLAPELQRKVIEARLKRGAQAIAARDAEQAVSKLFGVDTFKKVPSDAQEFFRETYNTPDGKTFWANLAKGAIDLPKVGLFALPFRHMANIGSLSFLADPSLANVFGTAGKFARLLLAGKNAEKRAGILGKAVKYGVTGTPSIDRRAAGWIGKIPLLGDLYKTSNHVLWSFDDAAKATRFQRLLASNTAKGMDEERAAYEAAHQVGAELIDYSNRSPLTQTLAYIAPFATYRSKAPGAIARVAVRHPERIQAVGRASPELAGDVQQAPGGKVGKSYLPLAESLRGIDNPFEYLRSTLGYPADMALSALSHSPDNYWTYGKSPDLKYLVNSTLGSFPGAQFGLNAIGQGEFKDQGDLSGALRGQTGLGLTQGPTLRQILAQQHVNQLQAQIEQARHAGLPTQHLEQQLRTFLQYNRLYEK